jgi:hypothetical protein
VFVHFSSLVRCYLLNPDLLLLGLFLLIDNIVRRPLDFLVALFLILILRLKVFHCYLDILGHLFDLFHLTFTSRSVN